MSFPELNLFPTTPEARDVVVMPGTGEFDFACLHSVAAEFGWTIQLVTDLKNDELRESLGRGSTAAVLFHIEDICAGRCSAPDAIRLLHADLPAARLIPCQGFSESSNWEDLSDAGAFHPLWLPLKENELRQCLGFIWQAEKRALPPARIRNVYSHLVSAA
jgi:hypothetical protein